jgi:hypothetical protein
MQVAERRLAWHQHQAPALLENHVGAAVNEMVAGADGDGGEAAHRARDDHHPFGDERARRDRRAHVVGVIARGCKRPNLIDRLAGLVLDGPLRPVADDEMGLDLAVPQRLQQPDAEYRPGGTRHPNDQSLRHNATSAAIGGKVGSTSQPAGNLAWPDVHYMDLNQLPLRSYLCQNSHIRKLVLPDYSP